VPKRVIDADAMWSSDKLAACAEWAQAEYAWLYGLADASGSFELTNLRVIWGRVAAIRRNFTIERLEQIFDDFNAHGLLFRWEAGGKRFGHWTGSDVPGRLPAPSWRARLEKLAPPVPRKELAEYVARFSCGPKQFAAAAKSESQQGTAQGWTGRSASGLKPRVEAAQSQDLNLGLNLNRNQIQGKDREAQLPFPQNLSEESADSNPKSTSDEASTATANPVLRAAAETLLAEAARSLDPWASRTAHDATTAAQSPARAAGNRSSTRAPTPQASWWQSRQDAKALQLARDLRLGRGPQLPPLRDATSEKSDATKELPARGKSAASGG
jgi:hypothetical protein